jgi:hypothetical protein
LIKASSASDHITGFSHLQTYELGERQVKTASKGCIDVVGLGTARLDCLDGVTFALTNVLHVKECGSNSLSIGTLNRKDVTVTFDIYKGSRIIYKENVL